MSDFLLAAGSAFGLGLLTSISPCPLATNIAAISYVARRVDRPGAVMLAGLLYTLGRTLAYVGLGIIIVSSLLASYQVSQFLQKYMNKILGPALILAGMLFLGLIGVTVRGGGLGQRLQARIEKLGLAGALVLGILFALSFCPSSAGFFFLSLIPLAIKHTSAVILPSVYGVGTAIPVVAFAIVMAFGGHSLGRFFNMTSRFEWWARHITGVLFVGLGIYYCITYIFLGR